MTLLHPRNHVALAAALLIAAVAVWARVWMTWAEPMWLDEGYSAYAAERGWHFLWTVVPRYETHPPFYYSLLRAWTLIAGDGLVAHRMLGIVCGIATIPVAALAAARLARMVGANALHVALAVAALVGTSRILVEMSREVRPYPLMILVYACATLALLAIADRRARGLPLAGRAFAGLVACTALMMWLHNLGPLYAFALGLGLLCVARVKTMARADWLWLAGGAVLILLIWLPALLILLDQAPMWVKATWLKFSTHDLWRRATLIYAGPRDDQRIVALLLLLLGAAVLWAAPGCRRLLAMLLILGFLPLDVSLLVSATISPVFIIRTMTPLAIPILLILGLGIGWRRGNWGWLLPAVLLGWLLVTHVSMSAQARAHPKRDWYRTIAWLKPRFQPGDVVFAYPNEGALPFDRAVRDTGVAMPSRAIPTAIPSLNPPPGSWYVSGSRGVPSLDRPHLRAIADEPATRAVPTIWLLRLGPWAYDKGDVFLDELSRGRTEVGRFRDGAIDIVGLRRTDISEERRFRPRPSRSELAGILRCMRQHSEKTDVEQLSRCTAFTVPEKMEGFWLLGFESSRFVETTRAELPKIVDISSATPSLGLMPNATAKAGSFVGKPLAYRVQFVGRRAILPGITEADEAVVVDRMLSIEPVTAPKERWLSGERSSVVTPAKAGVSGE